MSLVDHHRVVPQVYRALAGLRDSLPEETRVALQSRYQDNARKTLWFTAELVRILRQLESAGIKPIPYKGPLLAQLLYGEVTQRQFGDLDILVPPCDVPRARTALLALGYKSGIELTPRRERDYIDSGYEYSFHGAHGPHLLELQWQILPRFYSVDFDIADFFERADEIRVGSHGMRTLRAPDLLLVLCVHAAKHVWTQLSWLCDIAQLASSPQLDWTAIHDEARRLGIERILCLNLLLANQLLSAALPNSIHQQLRKDKTTTVLANEIRPLIERSQPYDTESIQYFQLMMRLRERRQDRARFVTRLAFTPSLSEWSAIRLPESLSQLYPAVRLARLAKRLASTG
jgi:putative nucleotidyltransferase-like protein